MDRAPNQRLMTGPADIPTGRAPKPLSGSSFEIPPGFRDNRGSNDVSLFSSSLPVLRHGKLSFVDASADGNSVENALPNINNLGKDVKGKVVLDDLDVQGIGRLLPDDEDLLAGIADDFDLAGLPNQVEDLDEDDVFGSGGGLEMDGDAGDYLSIGLARANINDAYVGNGAAQYAHPVGTIVGEHPYGEHPSRTLFVRNINSNVEDSELRSLFEQYGDIRTLYTACKHRGFVMISYYDIRDARTAMRALQNKPLRRRKLDIHFSIPKENPSDKDMNQGTLVVFNLDPSVSNDDLRQIFGTYGEVKEIRETPHKRHHKFVEFYDVRAAEAALRALNRSDIAGKRIKLEPSRPGGARRNLMQQLNQDMEPDETRSFRQQVGSPIASSPPGIWAQFNGPADNSLHSLSQSPTVGTVNSFSNKSSPGLASILPSLSNSVRIPPIGKDHGRSSYLDRAFGYGNSPHGITSQQSHSFPEKSSAVLPNLNSSPGTRSSFGHSTTGSSGIGTLTGPQFLWGSPTSDQSLNSAWKASPSTGHSFTSNGLRPGFPQSAHDSSFIPPTQPYIGHHVGSAPTGIPFERRFGYFPESSDAPFISPMTYGVGFSQNEGSLLMNMHARGTMSGGTAIHGQMSETGPPFRMMPSQRMSHMILGGSAYPIPGFASEVERARSRRVENNTSQFDSKKQYQLDLDKIKSGEDTRTTLMIKNIPNKYTAKMLLAAIDEKHQGMYDFFYLPIDFKNKCNVGYAFINMVSASHIIPFYQAFNGKKWDKFNSEKVASLAYARIQGKTALVSHFQNSSLMNEDKRCRPILFHYEGPEASELQDGWRLDQPRYLSVAARSRTFYPNESTNLPSSPNPQFQPTFLLGLLSSPAIPMANAGGSPPDPVDLSQMAARWRSGVEWDELTRRLDAEEVPERLNTVNSSGGFSFVSPEDKLTVHYSGVQQHGHDVGAVQANCPAPTQRLLYYFEMTVKNAGLKGQVAIGFTPPGVKLCRQPGWEANSCGYHGDDGFIYRGQGKGESFGPKFTSGDTVGAGINYGLQEFFFTKNGVLVGTTEKNIKGPIFPTVAVHSQNEEIIVNFGKRPFMFDIEGYESGERRKQQSTIDNLSIGVDVIHSIVRRYLQHYGYEDTLTSFNSESETALPPVPNTLDAASFDGNDFALTNRKILRELIRCGEVDAAFLKLKEWYPQVLQNEISTVCFLLHSQRFIEYIRQGNLEAAVNYARINLAKFFPVKSLEPLVQECIALLAYENPTSSSLGHLLDMGQREIVADAVNAAILSIGHTKACYMHSHLEILLRQLTVCRLELQAFKDNQDEAFYLHRALHGSSKRGRCG